MERNRIATPSSQDAAGAANAAPVAAIPLAVDLDGTLLLTDTLFEALAEHIRQRPFWALAQLIQLPFAIAKVKDRLTRNIQLDVERLPVNQDVLAYCEEARAAGREVWLVSAADQKMVDRVAARFGVFDRAFGSDGKTNNKGSAKARLLEREAPQGFEYVGDSPADYKVWKKAARASHVDKGEARRAAIEKLGVKVERSLARPKSGLAAWLKAIRVHQWAKNVLIFVPAVLAMKIVEPLVLAKLTGGFLLLSLMASGTYILNDLLDLQADRSHASKGKRPFASGRIKLWQGFVASPLLILGGLIGGFLLSPAFALVMLSYLIVTLLYSLKLKRMALTDTIALSFLYTLRLLMGAALAAVALSQWLLVFAMFLFVSLSLAKRHVEIVQRSKAGEARASNRGYRAEDAVLTIGLGQATATAAPLTLVLYIIDAAWPSGLYQSPWALWAAPVILSIWLMRVWLLANRGELHDDPVVFAFKDPQSLLAGLVLAVFFAAAVLLPADMFSILPLA
jgi:4-hydroxybenzoate polyprenyltransferase/phosphoserine phosphatase